MDNLPPGLSRSDMNYVEGTHCVDRKSCPFCGSSSFYSEEGIVFCTVCGEEQE